MTTERRPDLDPAAIAEARVIKNAFRHAGIHVKTEPEPDGGIAFMYQKGVLLVRDENLNRVLAIVAPPGAEILDPVYPEGEFPPERPVPEEREEESGREPPGETGEPSAWQPQLRRVTRGLVALALLGSRFGDDDHRDDDAEPGDEQGPSGVLLALEEIDRQLGVDVATPNHVVTVSPVMPCMATEPEEVPLGIEPEPGPCPGHGGAGVRISWPTPGWWTARRSSTPGWRGCGVTLTPTRPSRRPGLTRMCFGPMSGMARSWPGCCGAPRPGPRSTARTCSTWPAAPWRGAVPKLDVALDQGYQVFNLTISASTRKLLPLAAFDAWRRRLRERKGVACVVAAGNNGLERPFSPAAFPGMIAVGALAADGRSRASFSNHGSWVDVYARGRGLVNAWGTGDYHCYVPPHDGPHRHFHGMARCSGTSFSTPIVTGRIADRMSRTGENAEQAAAAVLARARFIPGVGRVVQPCPDEDCRHPDCRDRDCPDTDCTQRRC